MLNLSLPLLTSLNIADALFSFWIFNSFGIEEELNPVISAILTLDESALLFLCMKIGLSLVLITYWKLASKIRSGISALAMIGTIIYASFFIFGLMTVPQS